MKTVISFLLLWICFYVSMAQGIFKPTDYRCLTTPVSYLAEGEKQSGLFFLISHRDSSDQGLIKSSLFLLNKKEGNSLVYDGLTAVYELEASMKSTYTALLTIGEGHPWIEIVDTQILIDSHHYDPIGEIQPYPGNVSIVKWLDDKRLMVESDINLCVKNENIALTEKDVLDKSQQFIFDVPTKRFSILKK